MDILRYYTIHQKKLTYSQDGDNFSTIMHHIIMLHVVFIDFRLYNPLNKYFILYA